MSKIDTKALICQRCGAIMKIDEGKEQYICEYCGYTEVFEKNGSSHEPRDAGHQTPRVSVKQEKKNPLKSVVEWVEIFAVSVAAVMFILVCLGRHSPVNGSSMNDTLQQDDLLIISNLFYEPKQGDIVVFESTATTYERPYVKRVIAVGGQTIDYDPASGRVTVDGEVLDEEYAVYKGDPRIISGADITYPYEVPDGYVFVMGDNRWNSTDSRVIGAVDSRCIIGHVIFRLFPLGSAGAF